MSVVRKVKHSIAVDHVEQYQASDMSHPIDDFFFIHVGPASSEKCFSDVNNFQNLCQRLGVPLKDSKTDLP